MNETYRATPFQVLCARCRRPAVFRCPGCGTATCQEHTDFVELCPGCSVELHDGERRAGRVGGWLLMSMGAVAAGGVFLLGWSGLVIPSLLTGGFAAGTYRWLRVGRLRRGFRQRAAMFVLEGACVPLAREVAEDEAWRSRRSTGYTCRTRGELPEVPFYQRTYGGAG